MKRFCRISYNPIFKQFIKCTYEEEKKILKEYWKIVFLFYLFFQIYNFFIFMKDLTVFFILLVFSSSSLPLIFRLEDNGRKIKITAAQVKTKQSKTIFHWSRGCFFRKTCFSANKIFRFPGGWVTAFQTGQQRKMYSLSFVKILDFHN